MLAWSSETPTLLRGNKRSLSGSCLFDSRRHSQRGHPEDLRQPRGIWVEWMRVEGTVWALSHTACGCLGNGPGVYFVADSRLTLFCKCSFPTMSKDFVFGPLSLGVTEAGNGSPAGW